MEVLELQAALAAAPPKKFPDKNFKPRYPHVGTQQFEIRRYGRTTIARQSAG